MKPLSELFAEFPHETWWGGHLPEKCRRCRLEAWLRKAEEWRLEKKYQRGFHNDMRSRDVRRELLGTTRTEEG